MSAAPAMSASTLDSRARQTVDRVAAGLQSGAVAGIAEIVKLVEALAANALEISVQELAELIEKDVVVTAKVLMAANTLGYNSSGVQVTSIAQAIHVIGFTKIRLLALSLLLMENAERRMPTSEQRDASTLALTSGMVAQSWAEQHGRRDADQVFLCASLRNFGKLLMTAFLTDEYRKARDDGVESGDVDGAFRRILGITPLELGYELLRSANLPQVMLQGLRQFSPEMLRAATLDAPTEMLVAAEFSVRLADLALQPALGPEQFKTESRKLCGQFGRHLHVDPDAMQEMFERAEHRMTAFGRAFGLQTMARGVTSRFAARREGREVEPAVVPAPPPNPVPPAASVVPPISDAPKKNREPAAGADDGTGPTAAPAPERGKNTVEAVLPDLGETPREPGTVAAECAAAPVEPRPLVEVLREALAKAAETLASPEVRVDDIVAITVQALREGWGADEIVLLAERSKGAFGVLGGAGESWRSFKLKMGFRREDRNVLGVAAARGEPVLIHDAADPKIDPYLPPWFKAGLQLFSCIIVPRGEAANTHSVVMAGWRVRQKVRLSPEETRNIRALLGMVQAARRWTGT